MATVIDKPIQPFDDQTDFSRNNPNRQKWGEQKGAQNFHLGDEYAETTATPEAVVPNQPVTPPPAPPAPKFTHKLANGTTLEAGSVEALAAAIEKSIQQQAPPAPVEFEDDPVYKPIKFQRKELSLQEQANILNLMKENPQKAIRMLQEAEFGAPMETILNQLDRSEVREFNRREEEIGIEWVYDNVEKYNPTPENGQKLTKFLREKNKPITKKNLDIAFATLSASDPGMVKTPAPPPPDPTAELEEAPPPPTVVPSNQGGIVPPVQQSVDVDAFKKMTLKQQQDYFAKLRRA